MVVYTTQEHLPRTLKVHTPAKRSPRQRTVCLAGPVCVHVYHQTHVASPCACQLPITLTGESKETERAISRHNRISYTIAPWQLQARRWASLLPPRVICRPWLGKLAGTKDVTRATNGQKTQEGPECSGGRALLKVAEIHNLRRPLYTILRTNSMYSLKMRMETHSQKCLGKTSQEPKL